MTDTFTTEQRNLYRSCYRNDKLTLSAKLILGYLISLADEDNVVEFKKNDLVKELKLSKPTVIASLNRLVETGYMTRINNKTYSFNV